MSDLSSSATITNGADKPKRTARLGPTEIFSVPATQDNLEQLAAHADAQARSGVQGANGFHPDGGSEDEDDGEGRADYELEEGDTKVEDPDFLKDYPDTTEVSVNAFILFYFLQYSVSVVRTLMTPTPSGATPSTSQALE
jgi:hypothetical protein